MKEFVVLGLLRISMGFIFLWAFLDKTFGLGFSTISEKSWINGTSPTLGFLKNASYGPLKIFYNAIAGNITVDWLFMLGLLLIGLCLILGIGIRIASISGIVMMLLMWSSMFLPKNNPLIDEHIIYAIIFVLLILFDSGNYFGLGKKWKNFRFVKKYKFLK